MSVLVVLLLLACSIFCQENNNINVDDVQEEIPDDMAVENSQTAPACDSETDPSCKGQDLEESMYRSSDINKEITNIKYVKENKVDKALPQMSEEMNINDADTDHDAPADAETKTMSDPVSEQSGERSVSADAEKDTNNINGTSNSSTVFQWFRYVADQFLEEFKDGIYSKQAEPINTTETNLTIPLVNETIESKADNVTETTESLILNKTDTVNTTDTKKVKFHCSGRNITDNSNATVKLITSARLLQLLTFDKNETENMTDCLLVMFYAPWCHFCARTAPHYNAVARAFPQLDFVAVDTAQFSNLLARFGTVSVPNILIFHQSRAAVKFNQTERTFENLVSFIHNATGLEPNSTVNVTEADYAGPVSSVPTDDPDYLLLISWIFVIFCSSCMFVKSQKGQQWITRVRILWQEHQHID